MGTILSTDLPFAAEAVGVTTMMGVASGVPTGPGTAALWAPTLLPPQPVT